MGTNSGTYIKVTHKQVLLLNTLIEIGSFLIKVIEINK
jgi:hypothetical protein